MTQGTSNILTSLPIYGLIASLTLFYQQIKTGVTKFLGLFIKKCNIPSHLLFEVYLYLNESSFTLDSDNYRIERNTVFCKTNKRWLDVCIKKFKSHIFIYNKLIPILLICKGNDNYFIYYLKFTFNFEKFMTQVLARMNKKLLETPKTKPGNFRIETFTGKSFKDFDIKDKTNSSSSSTGQGNNAQSSSFNSTDEESNYSLIDSHRVFKMSLKQRIIGVNNLENYYFFLPNNNKNKYQFTKEGKLILNQLEKWYSLREFYEERNIHWRRGICLHGAPGNGKSSLILEVAKKAELPLFIFDISSMDNKEFQQKIEQISSYAGILLFEDIDSVFNGRENMSKNKFNSLTFDFFINQLSGIKSIENKFVCFTTNNLSKLDPALIRPGRIDEIIEIKPLTLEEKRGLAKIFIEDDDTLVEQLVIEGADDTSAMFENRCTKVVLERVWKK